jgi:hypothetical protein
MRFTFNADPAVLETAIEYADRAISAAPTLVDGYIWRGYALRRLGRYAEADAAFGRCRELDPSEKYGYYFAAGGAHWLHDSNRSIGLMQRAVEIDRAFGLGWWGLGCMHLLVGHYLEAISCFDRCSNANTMVGAAIVHGVGGYWGECLRRMGRLDEARSKCLAGLDEVERSDFMYRDTNRVFCLVALGRTAADQGDADAARAAYAHLRGWRDSITTFVRIRKPANARPRATSSIFHGCGWARTMSYVRNWPRPHVPWRRPTRYAFICCARRKPDRQAPVLAPHQSQTSFCGFVLLSRVPTAESRDHADATPVIQSDVLIRTAPVPATRERPWA